MVVQGTEAYSVNKINNHSFKNTQLVRIKGKFTQDLVSGTHDIVTDTQKNLLKFLYVSGYIYTKKSNLHTRIKLIFTNNNRCPVSIILM